MVMDFWKNMFKGNKPKEYKDLSTQEKDLVDAVYNDNIEKVKDLVDKGVEVNLGGKSDGTTLLHQAITYGFVDIARILIEAGANSNLKRENGRTPLHDAVQEGSYDSVELLADHHVNLNEQVSEKLDASGKVELGNTALMESSQNGYTDMVALLLKRGADPDIKGKGGFTALIISCIVGDFDCVKALIEGGANINITEERGLTALSFAEDRGYEDIVSLLKTSDAKRTLDTPFPCCWTCIQASESVNKQLICTKDIMNIKAVSRYYVCSIYEKRA